MSGVYVGNVKLRDHESHIDDYNSMYKKNICGDDKQGTRAKVDMSMIRSSSVVLGSDNVK